MLAPVKYEHIETVYTLEDARKIIEAENADRKAKRNKLIQQKLMGVLCLILTIIIPIALDGDATACLITAPMGIGLLVSKGIIIY